MTRWVKRSLDRTMASTKRRRLGWKAQLFHRTSNIGLGLAAQPTRYQPASSPSRLAPHAIAIAIQMRSVAGVAATHGRCAGCARFAAVRECARSRCGACGRKSRWGDVVGVRRIAGCRCCTTAMAVIAAAFAIVVATVFVESAAVRGSVAGEAQRECRSERLHRRIAFR